MGPRRTLHDVVTIRRDWSQLDAQPRSGRAAVAARPQARRWALIVLATLLAAAAVAAPWWVRTLLAPPPSAAPPASPAALPLVRHLAFDWLPSGYRVWGYTLDANRESLSAAPDPGAQVDQNLSAQVTAYQPGVAPAPDYRDAHDPWVDTPAADRVDGAPTQWSGLAAGRTSTELRLRWRYRPDSWAVLAFTGPSGADNLATALRIATGTDFDRAVPVRLPITAPGLPRALPLRAVDVHDPGPTDQWAVTLTYATADRPLDPNAPYPSLVVDAQAMNDALRSEMADPGSGADATVDGHPARRDVQQEPGDAYADQLQLWNVDGLRVAVDVIGQQTRDLLGGDALGVYHRLRLAPA